MPDIIYIRKNERKAECMNAWLVLKFLKINLYTGRMILLTLKNEETEYYEDNLNYFYREATRLEELFYA